MGVVCEHGEAAFASMSCLERDEYGERNPHAPGGVDLSCG